MTKAYSYARFSSARQASGEAFVVVSVMRGAKSYVVRDGKLTLAVDISKALVGDPELLATFTGGDRRRESLIIKMAKADD